MSNTWKWVLVGGAVLLAVAGVAALILRGRVAEARGAVADLFHAVHKQQVAERKQKLAQLQQQYGANDTRVLALKQELAEKRAALEEHYTDAGLTSAQIASRFADLDL